MSRYSRRELGLNDHEMYSKHFEDRDVRSIDQYATPEFMYPTDEQNKMISYTTHIWSSRDKYYILAQRYYGDPKLWWVIAQYNKAPTEQHLEEGQAIKVPYPLSSVYSYMGQK
jgi:nucleoid-associated protein YgaU